MKDDVPPRSAARRSHAEPTVAALATAKQARASHASALPSRPSCSPESSVIGLIGDVPFDEAVARFKKRYLTELLEACGFNITKAARFARVERKNFTRLLKRFNVPTRREAEEQRGPARIQLPPGVTVDDITIRGVLPTTADAFYSARDRVERQSLAHRVQQRSTSPTAMDNLRERAPRMEHVTRGEDRRYCEVSRDGEVCRDTSCALRLNGGKGPGNGVVCPRPQWPEPEDE